MDYILAVEAFDALDDGGEGIEDLFLGELDHRVVSSPVLQQSV